MSNRYVIALYIRLSIEDSKVESMSIDNQRLALHKFADTLDVPGSEVQEFVDNGYTGTNFERPSVQELLGLVQAGKINCIIVKDFTRFGRNSVDVGYYMEIVFPLYGVRFISLNDDFDSDRIRGETGGMSVAFKYLISEFYSRDLSIKYKSAKYVKFRRGEYQSKLCPYGYQKSADGRMEPDPETAPNVQLIFQMAAQGQNTTTIVKKLFDFHIPTPGEYKAQKKIANHDVSRCGGIWQRSSVLNILHDERYTGTYIIGKKEVRAVGGNLVRLKDESEWVKIPDHHPAIISKEQFDTAQKVIKRTKCVKKNVHMYPLRGKVYCGICHHRMSRIGNKIFRFLCRHTAATDSALCHGLKIEERELEKIVLEHITRQAQKLLSTNANTSAMQDFSTRSLSQIEKLQERKLDLYEQMISGSISGQEYVEQKAQIDEELAAVPRTGAKSANLSADIGVSCKQKSSQGELAQQAVESDKLTAELAEAFVERVEVFPGGEVTVIFRDE